jgi:glutaminyl-tRNA synthetase
VADALKAEVRLYDRLFAVPQPDTTDKEFLDELNPNSLKVAQGYVEASLATAKVGGSCRAVQGKSVYNWVTGMKDSWVKLRRGGHIG